VRLAVNVAFGPLGGIKVSDTGLQVAWEYWDGRRWTPLDVASVLVNGAAAADFTARDIYGFVLPDDGIPSSKLSGKDGRPVGARACRDARRLRPADTPRPGPPARAPPPPSEAAPEFYRNPPAVAGRRATGLRLPLAARPAAALPDVQRLRLRGPHRGPQ